VREGGREGGWVLRVLRVFRVDVFSSWAGERMEERRKRERGRKREHTVIFFASSMALSKGVKASPSFFPSSPPPLR